MKITKTTNVVTLALVAALGLWSQTPARAADIVVMVNQGALSGVRDLAAGFEQVTGNKVTVDFVGIPQMADKIKFDLPGDVLVNFLPSFDDYVKQGKVVAGTVAEWARAGNGVAV